MRTVEDDELNTINTVFAVNGNGNANRNGGNEIGSKSEVTGISGNGNRNVIATDL